MLTAAAWLPAEAFAGKYNSQGAATSLGQFFAAYFSLFIILLLPKCSLRMKVESMTSMLCFLPVSEPVHQLVIWPQPCCPSGHLISEWAPGM